MSDKKKTYEEWHAEFLEELKDIPPVNELDWGESYDPHADPEFVEAVCKAGFVNDILIAMDDQGLSKTDLAEKMDKKKAFISRVLNETSNFQIRTMAEFACALGMSLSVRLYGHRQKPVFLNEDEMVVSNNNPFVRFLIKTSEPTPTVIAPPGGGSMEMGKTEGAANDAFAA